VVFFDLLGIVLIHYQEWVGVIINLSVVIFSLYVTYTKVNTSHKIGEFEGRDQLLFRPHSLLLFV
jgi:hypothetical protein